MNAPVPVAVAVNEPARLAHAERPATVIDDVEELVSVLRRHAQEGSAT